MTILLFVIYSTVLFSYDKETTIQRDPAKVERIYERFHIEDRAK